MCEANSLIRVLVRGPGESSNLNISVIRTRCLTLKRKRQRETAESERASQILLESLILAQDERWRRA